MGRYLTVLVIAAALGVAWYWPADEQPASPPVTKMAPPASPGAGHRQELLDEIEIPFIRRSQALDACRQPDEKSEAELMAEYEVQSTEMLRVLEPSTDAEHLLVAALISWRKSPEKALVLLGRAEAANPRNPLIASQLLELCLEIPSCSRARPEMERNLIVADKANGIAWVTVARSRLSRNNEAGALAALREAIAAPSMDDHFTDFVLLFERALAASTDLPPFERSFAAYGHSAAVFTASFLITRDCNDRAVNSAEWRDACLRLGEHFEHSGQTILTKAVGMGLQAKMYEFGGDTRAQQNAERRYQQFRDDWTALASRTARVEELRDATVQRRYLDTFAAAGEIAAMEYLAGEIEARLPELDGRRDSACATP